MLRKQQTEIERTLKKVQEGLDEYDKIWDRVEDASTINQKEKHEGDLKKEIKRLQRYRELIKSWISNDAYKDKTILKNAKRQIEIRMESFKKCEKETKTKAFSKEALSSGGGLLKNNDLLSEAQKETKKWIETKH
ncbi:hypothetical protein RFI_37666 [Reticulomyxa filosa]|uniref:CCR4-Not complex component Not N-terminal domain-containing protein n=1 Tax=Reticulomyxa filosa TaxID=46433 RepID=X6LF95_RETFI|nr:hypothetical protein RFI_37666 [Reticulomyxa filosa]|eukprot:ETN99801.1 hypothetical protein RFI_37666 [Reticulomyxa filosa]